MFTEKLSVTAAALLAGESNACVQECLRAIALGRGIESGREVELDLYAPRAAAWQTELVLRAAAAQMRAAAAQNEAARLTRMACG